MASQNSSSSTSESKLTRPESKGDYLLAATQRVLEMLKCIADLCPVPGLKDAARITCTLLEMASVCFIESLSLYTEQRYNVWIQDAKSNTYAYSSMIHEIAVIIASAIQGIVNSDTESKLSMDLETLLGFGLIPWPPLDIALLIESHQMPPKMQESLRGFQPEKCFHEISNVKKGLREAQRHSAHSR